MAKKFKNLIPLIIWCQFNHLIIPYLNFWPMYKTTATEIEKKIYCCYSQTTIIQIS